MRVAGVHTETKTNEGFTNLPDIALCVFCPPAPETDAQRISFIPDVARRLIDVLPEHPFT